MTVPISSLTDTWNSGSTVFTAIQMNVTNTASAAGSKLLDLQVAGASQFSVDKAGIIAGTTLSTAKSNVLAGSLAGAALTTETNNVVIGLQAAQNAAGLNVDIYIGNAAGLNAFSTGGNNIGIGFNTLATLTGSAAGNVALGSAALSAPSLSGSNNLGIGPSALHSLTSASNNVGIGSNAGGSVTSGGSSVFIGASAGTSIVTQPSNVIIGANAMQAGGDVLACVAVGQNALNTCNGNYNTALGQSAGSLLTTGPSNIFIGQGCIPSITTGGYNTIIGAGINNAATSLGSNNASYLIALASGDGTLGMWSDNNASGTFSVGIGRNAGHYSVQTGPYNTSIGAGAGAALTSGGANAFLGVNAGGSLAGGSGNIFIGGWNGTTAAGFSITSGNYNVIIGAYGGSAALANNLAIADGQGNLWMQGDNTGAISFPRVGTTAATTPLAILTSSGPVNGLLRSTSSLRYKTAIRDVPPERIAAIEALKPIEYTSTSQADDPNTRFIGYAAEEVAKIDPALVSNDESGRPDSVMYDRVLLLQVAALKARVEKLENRSTQ